ncbi:nicotinamide/nicotinic acid mononucleotide adenylyltransferase 1-like [Dendronephthya gigantea]|uniref:nicotinamide/nicotinic acid mononucleotide adenylyltransferase 1-like n=1 Tax=Dendronephthya gigantea TaxID=151771 RepID=UPI00106B2B6D|nr:nicotinamide/nicotinic acid mononucleotide adenylyltransferase 1-like [Dendronephthya gigantea]
MAAGLGRKKIVLLSCGSFNPITNMHLRMFELARDALHRTGLFSVVEGILSPVNDDYKKLTTKKLASGHHRFSMAELATQSSNWINADDWEVKQSNWVPTVNVLEHTKETVVKKYSSSDSKDVPCVKLLCGGDLLESFAVPGLWNEEHMAAIVRDYGLVVITRSGSDPEKFIYESDLLTNYKNNIFIVKEWIYNDISSTKVRLALRRDESIKYVVPDPVIEYIKENNLYKN